MPSLLKGWVAIAALLLLGHAAAAQTNWGDYAGTSITFEDVTETSIFGDPEPLYGAPTVVGDQLFFFPANYTASAAGPGGIDQTGAQLQIVLQATAGTLTTVTITEFGDTTLTGVGTAATGTFAGIGGAITILDGASIGTIIPIPVDDVIFTLVSDPGITNWSLSATVDIGAVAPDATRAMFSFDNNLVASSELGTTASIQKKVVSGPVVVLSVPEPAALVLALLAGLALASRRRP